MPSVKLKKKSSIIIISLVDSKRYYSKYMLNSDNLVVIKKSTIYGPCLPINILANSSIIWSVRVSQGYGKQVFFKQYHWVYSSFMLKYGYLVYFGDWSIDMKLKVNQSICYLLWRSNFGYPQLTLICRFHTNVVILTCAWCMIYAGTSQSTASGTPVSCPVKPICPGLCPGT